MFGLTKAPKTDEKQEQNSLEERVKALESGYERLHLEWIDTLRDLRRAAAKTVTRTAREDVPRAPETTNAAPDGGLQQPRLLDPQIDRWAVSPRR